VTETVSRAAEPAGSAGPGTDAIPDHLKPGEFSEPYSERLTEFMKSGWGVQEEIPLPPAPAAQRLAARRDQLRARLPGGLPAVVPAGLAARRNDDQSYPFRAGSDYVWLTGDQTPGGVLLVDPGSAAGDVLFLVPPSGREDGEFYRDSAAGELWVGGRPSLEARAAALGVTCRPLAELPAALSALGRAVINRSFDAGVEQQLAAAGPELDAELTAILSELRLVKDDWEITQLRAAVDASMAGFCDVAALLRGSGGLAGLTERHLEGAFTRRTRLLGNGCGYHVIAGAGPHATTLHWNRNDGPLRDGDLLLMDAGAETNSLYTADVTRTFPLNGKFTSLQRQVYEIVLAAQEAGMAELRPGADFRAFYPASARVLAEGLEALGVLPVSAAESLQPDCGLHRRWTLHSPGHMLGLDVHDCSKARQAQYLGGPLAAGQVLTVEPGLYFQANDERVPEELRGIGVRIEDDVLITADGFENLSGPLPRDPDEIEAWCAAAGRMG
jgi:Xaa-Pro aminopeptidase